MQTSLRWIQIDVLAKKNPLRKLLKEQLLYLLNGNIQRVGWDKHKINKPKAFYMSKSWSLIYTEMYWNQFSLQAC